jgi:hypothetical protein
MSMTETVDTRVVSSNTDWGPILAGAAFATAMGLVLLAFGAALGLSVTSAYDDGGPSPAAYAVAAGLYLLWVQLMSFYIGGYITARLRARAPQVSEHEADVRDGLHGVLVWSVGVIAAALIAFGSISGATDAASAANDQLSSSVAQVVDQQVDQSVAEERVEGAPEAATASDAERRTEIVRKLTIISAFITAASLLAGLAAAFFGAHAGGRHRDGLTHLKLFANERVVKRA